MSPARENTINGHTWRKLRSVLDEEISRLPEKYRAPIILCHLEDKSSDQAAKELRCPKSSLATRLGRGRELLRKQLGRRGITLSAAVLKKALCEKAAGAPVPLRLMINTVKAAMAIAAGKAVAAGLVSARALALAEEAVRGMADIKGHCAS
jgi:Sigma-70, region 4